MALPGLIDTLLHNLIAHDVATKILDTEIFPRHTIADLSSGITFIVLLFR